MFHLLVPFSVFVNVNHTDNVSRAHEWTVGLTEH